jgi:carbon storage regulator CsrA
MLVLTRKYQEKIRIGENITITVLRMKGKAVRLGIEAPGNVPVIRGELAFEAPAEVSEVEFAAVDGETDEARSRSGRLVAGIANMTSEWATDTNPTPALTRSGEKREAAKVTFGRVSREQATNLLPKIAAGTAPLRTIMERRS